MSGEQDFLDEFEAEELGAEAVEQQQEPVEPAGSGRARGPDGKFIKAEAEAKAEEVETGAKEAAQANVTEPPSADEEGQTVPLSVMKALRKELQELKAAQKSQQTQPQSAPQYQQPQWVDPNEDPFGYLMQNIQNVEQVQENQHLNMSELFARQQVGDDAVDAAIEAFNSYRQSVPPQVAENFRLGIVSSAHPYRELLKWHQTQRDIERIQQAGGLDAFMKAQVAAYQQQSAPSQTGTRPAVPPSLASSGKATSFEPTDDGDGFDALFRN